jgi:drug/metabolite transporter (DMT)-like permease
MVSAVAFSLTSLLMKYNPVSRVSIYAFLNPVFGVLLSILILGESGQNFGLRGLLALCLVCAGVFTVNYSKTKTS